MSAAEASLDRRTVASWCLFDFANSAYSAVISATMFPIFYAQIVVGNHDGRGDLWWGRAVSTSMLFVALSSPLVGGIADRAGLRKHLWALYTLVCIGCVLGFTMLGPGAVVAGFLLATVANIGLEGGIVFYNSFLPEIAPRSHQGRVSGWGFATGYLGSIVALALAFAVKGDPVRWSLIWLVVATQFALFSLPAFRYLPADSRPRDSIAAAALHGLGETWRDLRELVANRPARRFLAAYVFYEDGVNTIIVFAAVFAAKTLGFVTSEVLLLFALIQVSALIGAWAMARPTDTVGPKPVIVASLLLWCGVVIAAYFVTSKAAFWCVGVTAGLGLGSVQAASRSLFASFIPPGRESRYFGVYALVGKSAAVMGPMLFGEVSHIMGSQRPAILSLAALFLIGLALLTRVESRQPR